MMNKIIDLLKNTLYLIIISIIHITFLVCCIGIITSKIGFILSIIMGFIVIFLWLFFKSKVQSAFKKGEYEDVFNMYGELIKD